MDEPPVRVEELAPAFLIAQVLEPGEQALARRDGISVLHDSKHERIPMNTNRNCHEWAVRADHSSERRDEEA
jgi:hypothetical protein